MNTKFIFDTLGESFFIECKYSMAADPGTDWDRFIQFLNHITPNSEFVGDSYPDYYGVIDGVGAIVGQDAHAVHGKVITIERFIEVLEASTYAVAVPNDAEPVATEEKSPVYVTLCEEIYGLDEQELQENCILVSCAESAYCDEYIREEDSRDVHSCYGGGTAYFEETSDDVHERIFITKSADAYSLVYSDYNESYVCTDSSYVYYGYINGRGHEGYFYKSDYVHCNYNDTCYADSDIASCYGVYWCDRRDRYVHEDEVSPVNANYHELSRHNLSREEDVFCVGFEIEKEDDSACQIDYSDLYYDTKWCKENDSSLDDDNGYELVSPIYGLYDKRFDADIQEPRIKQLVNAEYSTECGGHINLSSKKYNPDQLAEGLSGFFPMLYALYNGRLDRNYCKAKKKHEYYRQDKYSAIYIKSHLVEFRIFSAVRNVSNLLWRRDLIRLMVENINKSETDVLKMMLNKSSKLHKHLAKVYSPNEMMAKARLFLQYSEEFNNKKIDPPTNELGA